MFQDRQCFFLKALLRVSGQTVCVFEGLVACLRTMFLKALLRVGGQTVCVFEGLASCFRTDSGFF